MTAPELLLPEDPLDRLNYFNSQRLEAIDFKLEQAYHMRVRRWLNRSLYSAGIGAGLEVTADPADKHAVIVGPGLALDWLGREAILLNQRKVKVCGTPTRADGVTFGNYLVIAYREEKVAPQSDGCRVQGVYDNELDACGCKRSAHETNSCNGGCGCSGCKSGKGCQCGTSGSEAYAWGAPSRIRSEPLLMFQDTWPSESSGKILLAQVEMNAQCQVIGVKSGMRRYASASKPPTTIPISFEGEKDIDEHNPKVLQFHIEGGYPDTALLYLQGFRFSTLHYTEMGKHDHDVKVSLKDAVGTGAHTHGLAGLTTVDGGGGHSHTMTGNVDENPDEADNVLMVNDTSAHSANFNVKYGVALSPGEHKHTFPNDAQTAAAGAVASHNHEVTVVEQAAGVSNIASRSGAALTFVKALQVSYDGMNITPSVLAQLEALNPGSWAELGDGNIGHELVKNGTGPIDLRQIDGVDLSPGTHHTLVFAVAAGGGQIHYNLYVS